MNKAQNINSYRFSNVDKLFFDANIWLYIYGPQGNPNDRRPATYSGAFANAIRGNSQIIVDVLVISEFINRFARMEYDIRKPNKSNRLDFKQFRNSPTFAPIAQAIGSAVQKILKFAARSESGFTGVDILTLLTEFETGGHDFNDQILVSLCQAQKLKLVTHDADFKGKNINILTANQRILAP